MPTPSPEYQAPAPGAGATQRSKDRTAARAQAVIPEHLGPASSRWELACTPARATGGG